MSIQYVYIHYIVYSGNILFNTTQNKKYEIALRLEIMSN